MTVYIITIPVGHSGVVRSCIRSCIKRYIVTLSSTRTLSSLLHVPLARVLARESQGRGADCPGDEIVPGLGWNAVMHVAMLPDELAIEK